MFFYFRIAFLFFLVATFSSSLAQEENLPIKIEHAEPLYIDLIRDLGARKGEKEWNVGLGLTDKNNFNAYQALVEYEFAPANRLGVEFEIPVTFYTSNDIGQQAPSSLIESFKSAIQWTFLVSEKQRASFALGYINEVLFTDFDNYGKEPFIAGNLFNPFLIAAKRIGKDFHSLVYTGPRLEYSYHDHNWHNSFEINTSFHYMVPDTRNFIGIEFNKEILPTGFEMVARPQLRVSIADNLLIGIVTGVPILTGAEKISSFLRLIWEPGHRH